MPAPLIRTLELVADRRKGLLGVTPWAGPLVQRIVVVLQCGFPETHQIGPAVDIMELYAKEAGFRRSGALTLGMGGAVGRGLPAKPLMPRWLYLQAANWGFRSLLKKHGARRRKHDRPYA